VITISIFSSDKNTREIEKQIMDKILGIGVYDNKIRPSGANGTCKNVKFRFLLNSIVSSAINTNWTTLMLPGISNLNFSFRQSCCMLSACTYTAFSTYSNLT
jgi:hypothetical protein